MLYNSYCCIIMRRANQTGMHVRTCIHMEITSGLHCSAVFLVCAAPRPCPASVVLGLCWRRLRLGGAAELDPEAAPENPRHPHATGICMHIFMHMRTSLQTAVFLLCPAPCICPPAPPPPAPVPVVLGAGAESNPEASPKNPNAHPENARANQPKLG